MADILFMAGPWWRPLKNPFCINTLLKMCSIDWMGGGIGWPNNFTEVLLWASVSDWRHSLLGFIYHTRNSTCHIQFIDNTNTRIQKHYKWRCSAISSLGSMPNWESVIKQFENDLSHSLKSHNSWLDRREPRTCTHPTKWTKIEIGYHSSHTRSVDCTQWALNECKFLALMG